MLKLGNIELTGKVILAPMAGITDSAFRLIARSFGASLVFTELISTNGLVRNCNKTYRLMQFLPEERPIGIQLFGQDPDIVSRAVECVQPFQPELIDLNVGCPSKRVVRHGAGAALLKDLDRLRSVVCSAVSASSIPVSVKIRSGWDESNIVAVEAARISENAGACAVTVHARTKTMGFHGKAVWEIIQQVKESVSIPVIGNGDIFSPIDTKKMLEMTGCDFIMVGRGVFGRPWIFHQIKTFLDSGTSIKDPSKKEKIHICLKHYDLALRLAGRERGVREMRKHIGWYLKGIQNSHRVKQKIMTCTDPEKVKSVLSQFAKIVDE